MNKMLKMPAVESAFASNLVDQEAGSVISNAPKKEMANTTSRAKNKRLKTALVDMLFNALAPNITVISTPRVTYIRTIDKPYKIASRLPLAFFSDLLRKKLTVMGMIGQTQGVNSARKPPANPARKISQREMSPELPS
ncbi:hypothetical protein SDC9_166910 [bioreactor metagenome]|uniref:Uncharacterized protein n=1 Tax=bioreactor metagenome TaxID=1076179 RepID=A0A645G153_9ZZZZ